MRRAARNVAVIRHTYNLVDLPIVVAGKTGTAEFGNGNPPPTHAWFVGYRGNIAFAVVVEGGGVGGRVAAPLAAKFANSLP
jgi:cell division protein FtsI/penicillin-binding protein 2